MDLGKWILYFTWQTLFSQSDLQGDPALYWWISLNKNYAMTHIFEEIISVILRGSGCWIYTLTAADWDHIQYRICSCWALHLSATDVFRTPEMRKQTRTTSLNTSGASALNHSMSLLICRITGSWPCQVGCRLTLCAHWWRLLPSSGL